MKIGVRLDAREDFEITPTYAEIRELALAAEGGRLNSIWLSDHLFYRFDPAVTVGSWECWTFLSALAEATNRVELGTLVLCNSFRNPALLAKMAHTLDEISNGRLTLGVGAGWHQPEYDAYGYPFDRRVNRLEEALQILSPLLKGKSVNFSGIHYDVQDCIIKPLGPRPDGIPLLVGAFGSRMLRLTARYADHWNTVWHGEQQDILEPLQKMRNACVEVGRDPTSLGMTVGASVAFPDLGETNSFAEKPMTGSVESLAQSFQKYADSGVSHLIIQHTPRSLPALERVAEAARIYRSETQ